MKSSAQASAARLLDQLCGAAAGDLRFQTSLRTPSRRYKHEVFLGITLSSVRRAAKIHEAAVKRVSTSPLWQSRYSELPSCNRCPSRTVFQPRLFIAKTLNTKAYSRTAVVPIEVLPTLVDTRTRWPSARNTKPRPVFLEMKLGPQCL